jgi:hypothetical protein
MVEALSLLCSEPVAKDMSTPITRSGIEELRKRIRRLEGAAGRRRLVLPYGLMEIDRHLRGGGLALGALHEVAGGGHGAIDGAAAALFTAGIAARTRGKVLRCKGSRSVGSAQRFLSVDAAAYNTFNVQRHLTSARTHRAFRASAMNIWHAAVAVA